MFGFSGVIIIIKLIDMHICHDSSVGFISRRDHALQWQPAFTKLCFCPFLGRWLVGRVFSSGVCHSEMVLPPVLVDSKEKLQNYQNVGRIWLK